MSEFNTGCPLFIGLPAPSIAYARHLSVREDAFRMDVPIIGRVCASQKDRDSIKSVVVANAMCEAEFGNAFREYWNRVIRFYWTTDAAREARAMDSAVRSLEARRRSR